MRPTTPIHAVAHAHSNNNDKHSPLPPFPLHSPIAHTPSPPKVMSFIR